MGNLRGFRRRSYAAANYETHTASPEIAAAIRSGATIGEDRAGRDVFVAMCAAAERGEEIPPHARTEFAAVRAGRDVFAELYRAALLAYRIERESAGVAT